MLMPTDSCIALGSSVGLNFPESYHRLKNK